MLQSQGSVGPHCTHAFGRAGAEGRPAGQNPPSAIHLWRIPLDACSAPPAGWECMLTPDEQARAARFRFLADRARWVQTRRAVRVLLGQCLHCPPREVPLVYGAHGKPALRPGFRPIPLHFNWSHAPDVALLAVTEGGPVGVDVERLRADFDPDALASQVLTLGEQECLRASPAADRHALFLAFWTAKEAVLKALGVGLSLPPNGFSVAAVACQGAARAHGITVRPIPLGGSHAAALACALKDPQICLHAWHDTCIPAP